MAAGLDGLEKERATVDYNLMLKTKGFVVALDERSTIPRVDAVVIARRRHSVPNERCAETQKKCNRCYFGSVGASPMLEVVVVRSGSVADHCCNCEIYLITIR